jgi:hypothetical protein
MSTRKCLVKAPVWADTFYSGYDDQDDPEDQGFSNRASTSRRASKPGNRLPPPKTHR